MDAPHPRRDLRGRTALVTGANAGIGYWCTEQLALRGARVILGCRSAERAAAAVSAIRGRVPDADLRVLPLDLGSLTSIATAASGLDGQLDAIIGNAGVKAADRAARTDDGFDLMMGTNFLGHFALIAQLAPSLAPDGRVVVVGSITHRYARLDPARIDAPWHGSSLAQYGRSKAAAMTFAFELARRWKGSSRIAACAHPGYAVDPLSPRRSGLTEVPAFLRALAAPSRALVQGKDGGALPIVHAATAADVVDGDYWGPGGLLELRGAPVRVATTEAVRAPATGSALWAAAESLTGVRFPV